MRRLLRPVQGQARDLATEQSLHVFRVGITSPSSAHGQVLVFETLEQLLVGFLQRSVQVQGNLGLLFRCHTVWMSKGFQIGFHFIQWHGNIAFHVNP